jgi:RHS repeat-associated protein
VNIHNRAWWRRLVIPTALSLTLNLIVPTGPAATHVTGKAGQSTAAVTARNQQAIGTQSTVRHATASATNALRELTTLRSQFAKIFQAGSTLKAVVSIVPVHFRDSSGKWQDIDSALVISPRAGYAARNKANSWTVDLPVSLKDAVQLSTPQGSLGISAAGATAIGIADGSKDNYLNAWPGVAVSYQPNASGLMQTLVLDSLSAAAATMRFYLTLPTGSKAKQLPGGEIDILSSKGNVLFAIPHSYMRDSRFGSSSVSDSLSPSVKTTLGQDNLGTYFQITPDHTWLSSPSRSWPVTIDPSITVQPTTNCTIITPPYTSTCGNDILQVGYYNGSTSRALLQFPNPGMERVATVLNASVGMYLTYAASTSQSIEMHGITRAWTNQATWSTYDGSHSWTTAGGDFTSTPEWTTSGFTTINSWYQWYPTKLTQGWLNATSNNYGVVVKATNESSTGQAVTFASTFNGNSSLYPYLTIDYSANVGDAAEYVRDSHQLTDRLTAKANVGDGNLYLQLHNFGVQGVGLNLSLDSYFNSYVADASDLGYGWNLGLGYDVWLDTWDFPDGAIFHSPTGKAYRFAVSGSNFTSPPGINAKLANGSGGAHTITYNSSAEVLTFDANGFLTKEADRNGNPITFLYDANSALASVTDTENRVTTFSYTPTGSCGWTASGLITAITDSANRQYKFGYDPVTCALTSYTDPQNGIANPLSFVWQANSNLDHIVDNRGNTTKFTYLTDPTAGWLGSLGRVYDGLGDAYTTTYSYGVIPNNSPAGINTVTDPNNHQTQFTLDNGGLQTKVVDALGHSHSVTHNGNYNATQLTDAYLKVTNLSYDANNNLTQIQAAPSASGQTAASTKFGYQAPSQPFLPSSRTDTMGNCRAFTYDATGNMTTAYDGQTSPCDGHTGGVSSCNAYKGDPSGTCGATTTVTCTNAKAGELCWTQDGRSNRTSYSYDSNSNLNTITPPAPLGAVHVTVDSLSRVVSVTDGNGQVTAYSYDALDRTTQILFGGTNTCVSPTCTTFTYDANGNLASRTDATGTTQFAYEKLNRVTAKTPQGGSVTCGGSTMSFAYDGVGNLTQYCDAGGNVTYAYNSVNRVASLAEPTGSCSGTPTLCTTYTYDNNDRLTKLTFPGGASQNMAYDGAGNETSATGTTSSGGNIASFTYTYAQGTADKGVRLSMTENDAMATNLTTSYTYDLFGRLITATNSQSTLHYAYDNAGNRCSTGTTCDGSWSYNAANELTASPGVSSYSYDGNGNLTASAAGGALSYNSQNQTTSTTWGGQTLSSMTYADVGQSERVSAGSTTFVSSPLGAQISTTQAANTYYVHDGKGNLIGEQTPTTPPNYQHWYFLKDGIGSVVAVIDGSGATVADRYRYDPYGKLIASQGTLANPWGFAGGYLDSTSLVKFGDRYYDPNLGRWTQRDALAGAISAPTSLDRYTYAGCNPTNFVDRTGAACEWPWLFAGATTIIAGSLPLDLGIAGVLIAGEGWAVAAELALNPVLDAILVAGFVVGFGLLYLGGCQVF